MKNTSLSEPQLLGFSETVQKTLAEERDLMSAAGYDPETMRRNMKQVYDDFVSEGAHQEDLKRQLRDSTRKLDSLKRKLYNLTSGGVDALLTAVDRSSPAGKIIRRLRSRIRRIEEDKPVPLPAPPVDSK